MVAVTPFANTPERDVTATCPPDPYTTAFEFTTVFAVEPSKRFISEAVDVTPSRMFSSAAVVVTAVPPISSLSFTMSTVAPPAVSNLSALASN